MHHCAIRWTAVAPLLVAVVGGASVSPAAGSSNAPSCFGLQPTVVGTSGDDELQGSADVVDVVWAGPGNDTVRGPWTEGVGDVVCGGPGDDFLPGGPGDDRIDGGLGRDSVNGGNGGDDVLLGGPGRDSVMDTDDCEFDDAVGTDVLRGGPGPDYLCSFDGRDALYGEDGDDHLSDGAAGRTRLHGGAGDDTMVSWRFRAWRGAVRPDVVSGGAGTDSALVSRLDKVLQTELVTVYVDPEG